MLSLFNTCEVTQAGRAVLASDETELLSAVPRVGVLDSNMQPVVDVGTLIVTNRRLIVISSSHSASAFPMESILSYSRTGDAFTFVIIAFMYLFIIITTHTILHYCYIPIRTF